MGHVNVMTIFQMSLESVCTIQKGNIIITPAHYQLQWDFIFLLLFEPLGFIFPSISPQPRGLEADFSPNENWDPQVITWIQELEILEKKTSNDTRLTIQLWELVILFACGNHTWSTDCMRFLLFRAKILALLNPNLNTHPIQSSQLSPRLTSVLI